MIDIQKFAKAIGSTENARLTKVGDNVLATTPKNFRGRIVQYICDKLGLNKAQNREVTKLFIDSVSSHYKHDPSLVRDIIRDLKNILLRGKPLTARQVRDVLETADAWDIKDLDDWDDFSKE